MPFKYGGTTLTDVKYNGVSLTKVTYNGTVVYEPFIYYGFEDDNNTYRYNINLSSSIQSQNLGIYDNVQEIKTDGNHIFFYSENSGRIHKVEKNLPSTQIAQTGSTIDVADNSSVSGFSPTIFIDGTDLYSTGSSDTRLTRYLTSNLSIAQSGTRSFPDDITQILVDNTHVYVACANRSQIFRILKSNLSGSLEASVTLVGIIHSIAQDNDYIYGVGRDSRAFIKIPKATFTSSSNIINFNTGFANEPVTQTSMCAVDNNNFYHIVRETGNSCLRRTDLVGLNQTNSTYSFNSRPRRMQLFGNKIFVGCENARIVIFDKSNFNSGTEYIVNNPSSTADINGFLID
jgi:hypothetical protein